MTVRVPIAVLEEAFQRSVDGFASLSNTLDQILAAVAELGDAELRQRVETIMASRRRPERVDFADLHCGDAVH